MYTGTPQEKQIIELFNHLPGNNAPRYAECHVRETMINAIRQSLVWYQEKSPEQIVTLFVAQYGELASPPKKGFNLMAWTLPLSPSLWAVQEFYILMNKWVHRGREAGDSAAVPESGESDEYRDRVEKDLADYSERSFR